MGELVRIPNAPPNALKSLSGSTKVVGSIKDNEMLLGNQSPNVKRK